MDKAIKFNKEAEFVQKPVVPMNDKVYECSIHGQNVGAIEVKFEPNGKDIVRLNGNYCLACWIEHLQDVRVRPVTEVKDDKEKKTT